MTSSKFFKQISIVTFLLCRLTANSQCLFDFNYQQDLCEPRTISFSTAVTGVQSFEWNFGNSVINTVTLNPVISYPEFGSYTVSLTITFSNGCMYTKTKTVTVSAQQDNNLISTTNSTVCFGDSILLESVGSGNNFCWHTAAGPINNSNQQIYVSPDSPTTYYLSSQDAGGELFINGDFSSGNTGFNSGYNYCNTAQCITEGYYVIGNDPPFFHIDFSGSDHTTGSGNYMMINGALTANVPVWCQTVTVSPNSNYDFSAWISTVAGEYAPAQLQVEINNVPVGNVVTAPSTIHTWIHHTATWNSGSATSASVCIVSRSDWFGGNDFGLDDISFGTPGTGIRIDSVNIGLQTSPQLQVSVSPDICAGASIQLNATTNASVIEWTPSTYLSDPHVAAPLVLDLPATTTFYIQAANGNCIKKDSVTVTVLDKPLIVITPVNGICQGTGVTLNAAVSEATAYHWVAATGIADPNSLNPLVFPANSTTYTLIANNGACIDSAAITVNVATVPKVVVQKSNDIDCLNRSSTLTASGANNYSWSPNESISFTNGPGQVVVNPGHTVTYYVQSTGTNGCVGKDSITVNFLKYGVGQIFVPGAFTPNGDGKNDVFKATVRTSFNKFQLKVFNRWGELVFTSKDPGIGWNGRYKTHLPLSGAYTYYLNIEGDCGSDFMKGSVLLIK